MTEKTNTSKNQSINKVNDETETMVITSHIAQDFRNSVLIVSVVANLFVLTAWIALQVTTKYDSQVATFLFGA
jgi:hypothetical protein